MVHCLTHSVSQPLFLLNMSKGWSCPALVSMHLNLERVTQNRRCFLNLMSDIFKYCSALWKVTFNETGNAKPIGAETPRQINRLLLQMQYNYPLAFRQIQATWYMKRCMILCDIYLIILSSTTKT